MKAFDVAAVEKAIGGLTDEYPHGPKMAISDDDSTSVWYRRSRLFQVGDVVGVLEHGYGYYMKYIGQVTGKPNGTYDIKLLRRHPSDEPACEKNDVIKNVPGRRLWCIDSPELRTLLELEPKVQNHPGSDHKQARPGRKRMADFSHVLTKAQKKLKRYGDMYVALDELKVSIARASKDLCPEDMDAVTADMREALSTVRMQVDDIRDGGAMYKEMNWDGGEHQEESSSSSSEGD